jgi:heat shock protein HslJ
MLAKRQTLSLFLTFIISLTLYANDSNLTDTHPDQNVTFSTTYWKLIDLDEHTISSDKMSREAHIVFSNMSEGKGKFNGASGCNDMIGKYIGHDNNISIDTKHIAMTRMACPYMEIETQFIHILGKAVSWSINAGHLSLKDINGSSIALFKADKTKTQLR